MLTKREKWLLNQAFHWDGVLPIHTKENTFDLWLKENETRLEAEAPDGWISVDELTTDNIRLKSIINKVGSAYKNLYIAQFKQEADNSVTDLIQAVLENKDD